MEIPGLSIALIILFYLLGKSADLVVINVRRLGEALGVKIFSLGIVLGFLTSLPELAVGANSLLLNLRALSLGNLLGGIIVVFGLVLGVSVVMNRSIATNARAGSFLPVVIFIMAPLLLGADGAISRIDGAAIIIGYGLVLWYLLARGPHEKFERHDTIRGIAGKTLFILIGIAAVLVLSHYIIQATLLLTRGLNISPFVIGLVLFSIGTNLPEIIVAIRSWRRNVEELSLSNLVGSAIANPAIVGIFALIKPFTAEVGPPYYLLLIFTLILLAVLNRFYETERRLTRLEGVALIVFYVLFVALQMLIFVA
ncbi:MAG: sodium:calcium antiporter [Candidatus Brennerbacteria bacterium]|nr:sodium:calcium antiporter [Candidatus Brennerbacteria bacterium]